MKKKPHEILLERHRVAEARLDAIRARVLEPMAASSPFGASSTGRYPMRPQATPRHERTIQSRYALAGAGILPTSYE